MEHTFHYLVFTETEQYGDIYHKADADLVIAERDKVIEEQDEKIDELEEHIDELQKATDSAWSKANTMYDELRNQKYNRCMDNAWWCRKLSNVYALIAYTHRGWKIAGYYDEKADFYRKWHQRWLKIAEKFKEAK